MNDTIFYTVRYWIGPASIEDSKYYKAYKKYLKSIDDLLPSYTIEKVFGDLWLYCSCPIQDSVKDIMERGYYCDLFRHVTYREFEV